MIRETYKLVKTVKKMYPVVQFLKDRYFPDGPVYYSEKALIEFKKKGRKIAPFVIPLVNGIVMEKDGYRTDIVDAPYIAPKRVITAKELEQKAFGESPESGRSPEQRENELESEFIDDNRISILRRHEKMCADILLTGQVIMKHYATAEDAAKGENYDFKYLRFYEGEFKNKYKFTKKFKDMTTAEKIQEFYKMATVLRKRGVRATDIVMTSDVSMLLMSDKDFLEFYNKAKVNIGEINPTELPDGVVSNGSININGVVMTLFTYDEIYEDLDGEEKAILPAGTIAFLQPNMGTTVYAQVTFYTKDGFKSYAEKIVPRLVGDEKSNMAEVQAFSRPVMYPNDMDGWLVANIYDETASTQTEADNSVDTHEPPTADVSTLKTEAEITAMTKKAELIAYATSIGLSGLDNSMKLDELQDAILNYQEEIYGE
ncbi:major capsid protein [Butyribacter intestini]|uniref:major capsid protein n=1 Tax=Butyribacter intestini TaxID=1703332 RepID=UPI003AB2F46D